MVRLRSKVDRFEEDSFCQTKYWFVCERGILFPDASLHESSAFPLFFITFSPPIPFPLSFHPFPSPLFSLSLSPYFYTHLPSIFLSSPLPSLSLSSSFPFSLSFLPSPLPIFPLSFLPFLSLSPPFPFSPLPSFPPPPFPYLSPSFRFTLPSLSLSSPIFPFPSLFPSVFLIKNLIV